MNLRLALKERLQGSSAGELKSIIEEGITSQEEAILPGLGVLFEHYYQSLDNTNKAELCATLKALLSI